MALNTFVYIRDVNNLSDARYCAGMGVDLLGFRLDPDQENHLDASRFKEITDWISGVKIVGEFGALPTGHIRQILPELNPDYMLVPTINLLDGYTELNKPLILSMEIDQITDSVLAELNYRSGTFEYILVTGNSTHITDSEKSRVSELSILHPVMLGFGFDEHTAGILVTELGAEGISMGGSSEIRPGYKDYDVLADILEALESD